MDAISSGKEGRAPGRVEPSSPRAASACSGATSRGSVRGRERGRRAEREKIERLWKSIRARPGCHAGATPRNRRRRAGTGELTRRPRPIASPGAAVPGRPAGEGSRVFPSRHARATLLDAMIPRPATVCRGDGGARPPRPGAARAGSPRTLLRLPRRDVARRRRRTACPRTSDDVRAARRRHARRRPAPHRAAAGRRGTAAARQAGRVLRLLDDPRVQRIARSAECRPRATRREPPRRSNGPLRAGSQRRPGSSSAAVPQAAAPRANCIALEPT